MYEVLQTALTVAFLFKLLEKRQWNYAIVFFIISVLFVLLKSQLVPYALWGALDRFLWGTYNVAFIVFFHFYCFRSDYGNINTPTHKIKICPPMSVRRSSNVPFWDTNK